MLVQIVIYENLSHNYTSPLIDSKTPINTPKQPHKHNHVSISIGITSNPLLYIDKPTLSTLIKKEGGRENSPPPVGD
jgi:hypothetical protein